MTVSVPTDLVFSTDADGMTTVFSYPVRFLDAAELVVIQRIGETDTVKVLDTDYTVTGAGDPSGGSITMLSVPTEGKIIRYRKTAAKQIVDLKDTQRNPAEAVEQQLDRLAMVEQDQNELIGRSPKYKPGVAAIAEGHFWKADAAGNLVDGGSAADISGAQGHAAAAAAAEAAAEAAQGYAEEWAQKGEDTPVSVAAGGDGSTDFSSLHWAAKAADYAALALNNWVIDTFPGDGATKDFTLSVAPGLAANCFVTVDGVLQQKSTYSVTGTLFSFTTAPPGDAVTENIEVAHGTAVVMDINDATTLNGQNPAYYLDLANSTGEIPDAQLPGRLHAALSSPWETDLDNATGSGWHYFTDTTLNTPTAWWGLVFVAGNSGDVLQNAYTTHTPPQHYVRLKTGGAWGAWERHYDTAVELDARYAAQSSGTWTPAVSFGGAAVGATYNANNKGSWIKTGKLVVAKFQLELTAKGSSTGTASLTGLPFTSANDGIFGGGAVGLAGLFSTVTGSIAATVNPNSSEAYLYQAGDGASSRLTNANFTDTSYIYGTLTYEAAS